MNMIGRVFNIVHKNLLDIYTKKHNKEKVVQELCTEYEETA